MKKSICLILIIFLIYVVFHNYVNPLNETLLNLDNSTNSETLNLDAQKENLEKTKDEINKEIVDVTEQYTKENEIEQTKLNINEEKSGEQKNEIKEEIIDITKEVPILMYHCIGESSQMYTEVSAEKFEKQIQMLKEKGYTTIFIEDIVRFVEEGVMLPEKPICITFDDGYLDNYEMAYPILKKYNMKATIFVIGSMIGDDGYYKDTMYPDRPHFTTEQAKEMVNSGLISIQSHTYDMHQWAPCETGDYIRENIVKLKNETEEEYKKVLIEDNNKMDKIIEEIGDKLVGVSYPSGKYDKLTSEVLKENGVKVTLTIEPGINTITQGKSESLYNLKRINVYENLSEKNLLKLISGN